MESIKNNLKTIYRIFSIILVIFFFVPSFTVSCANQAVGVSGAHSVIGYSIEGEKVAKGNIFVLVLLMMAILILAVTMASGLLLKQMSTVVLVASIVNIAGWLFFKSGVENFAEENMCVFEIGPGFYINVGCSLILVIVSILNLLSSAQEVTVVNAVGATDWVCPDCGAVLKFNDKFCAKCGAHKPENQSSVIPGGWICPGCGATLSNNDMFCAKCGYKKPEAAPVERTCKSCGAKLDDNSAFCASCGAKVEG